MNKFKTLLSGGDLRSIGQSNSVVLKIKNQENFDELFKLLFFNDRLVIMRAADAIEKISIKAPHYLAKHKNELIELCYTVCPKELKWHLALLIPRVDLNTEELNSANDILMKWATDKTESRIVRVNSIQGLFEITMLHNRLKNDFIHTLSVLEKENIPSINARIKSIRKKITL
ncbi:MAG: hypothetical protein ACXVB0_07670 [Mucilaginibacter sp.]